MVINWAEPQPKVALTVSPNGGKCGHFPTYRTERGKFQLCSVLIVIIIAGHRRGLLDTLVTAATAALHKGSTERFAKREEEYGSHARFKEQQKLTDEVQEVHSLPGHPRRHIGSDDVADVFGNDAKPV